MAVFGHFLGVRPAARVVTLAAGFAGSLIRGPAFSFPQGITNCDSSPFQSATRARSDSGAETKQKSRRGEPPGERTPQRRR